MAGKIRVQVKKPRRPQGSGDLDLRTPSGKELPY